MVMSSVVGVQTPLEIVHRKVLIPKLNPVTPDVEDVGEVTVALPAITVHAPVPTVGAFPASVAIVTQSVWSGPAVATVGKSKRVIVILSLEGAQTPFEILHRKVLTPTVKPVTPDVGEVGVVTVAPPTTTVQSPVPTIGLFPASVAVVAQTL